MKKTIAIAFGLTALTFGIASADVVLRPGDTRKIDHKRYYCAPDQPHDNGIELAIGDSITVRGRRITCEEDVAPLPPPPPPPQLVNLTSTVDTNCVDNLYTKIGGRLPQSEAASFARACRNVELPAGCSIIESRDDDWCFQSLYTKIDGQFSPEVALHARAACRQITASCPASPATATSTVDAGCLDQLFTSTSGRPSASDALAWLRGCRAQPIERCTAVGGQPDLNCIDKIYTLVSGKLTAREAADVARACRAVDVSCL